MASGLAITRLARLDALMASYADRGEVPGLTWLVTRHGETHAGAAGYLSLEPESPICERDALFRISSMTKPVTAVAALLLVEEGVIRLDDPIEDWLPELAERRVLSRWDAPLDDTVPGERSITLRDALTFTLGYGMVMGPPESAPIAAAMVELELGLGPPKPQGAPPPDEWVRRLGTLPLQHQPGAQWTYNAGSDVTAVLVGRASGQPFDQFVRDRIFEPLGMHDTAFFVDPTRLGRFTTCYATDFETGEPFVYDAAAGGQWSRPPAFPAGSAGLVSTIDDFAAFGRMLLDGGRYGSGRLLSRVSVQAMTTNHLSDTQRAGAAFVPGFFETRGWGFGLSIITQREGTTLSPGTFGWNGGLGSVWYSDPVENMVLVLMSNQGWTSPNPPPVVRDFFTLAYAAIED